MYVITARSAQGTEKWLQLGRNGIAFLDPSGGMDEATQLVRISDAQDCVLLLTQLREGPAHREGERLREWALSCGWIGDSGDRSGYVVTTGAWNRTGRAGEPAGYLRLWMPRRDSLPNMPVEVRAREGAGPGSAGSADQATRFGNRASADGTSGFVQSVWHTWTEKNALATREFNAAVRETVAAKPATASDADPETESADESGREPQETKEEGAGGAGAAGDRQMTTPEADAGS